MMNARECVEKRQMQLKESGTATRERERASSLLKGELNALKAMKKSMGSRSKLGTSFYISTSAKGEISVRVRGEVVGTVTLQDGAPKFTGGELKDEDWNSKKVLNVIKAHAPKTSSVEKNIEAALLTMLESKVERAVGHPLRKHAAVKFPPGTGALRIQFPNPAAPRGDKSTGHVDILARRGSGRSSILRVLEVKKPKATDSVRKTLEQAIAYCVGIAEAASPDIWKLYGYSKGTPPAALEATAVLDKDSKGCDFETCQKVLSEMGSAKIGPFNLSLSILLYTLDARGKLKLEQVPDPK